MKKINKYFVFGVSDQMFALALPFVEKVIQVVEITPLPKSPEHIFGIIDYHGQIIPVVNMRILFGLPEKEIELSDYLIITKTETRLVALLIDFIDDTIEKADEEIGKSENFLLETRHVKGILKLNDGAVLIHDLDQLLTSDEVKLLKAALIKQKENNK